MKARLREGPPYRLIAGATLAIGGPAIFEYFMLGFWITLALNAAAGIMVVIALRLRERAFRREMLLRRKNDPSP